jgi:TadE-like protein
VAELVVVTPIIVVFAMIAMALGRYEMVRERVVDATRAAAQAATVTLSEDGMAAAAGAAVRPVLAGLPGSCPDPVVTTVVHNLGAGVTAEVTVSCDVPVSEFGVPGIPGTFKLSVTETAPIDPYRTLQ